MKKVVVLNKKEGETPLEALDKFRQKYSEYKNSKMTYAGRLDPMASGLLLILVGEEINNKEKYLALGKEYKFEVLFGFSTDTYDILGKVVKQKSSAAFSLERLKKEIKQNIKSFLGENVQRYPVYSSKTVKGKPLFSYARAGEEVDIPERKIFIKKLKLEKVREMNNKRLFQNIKKRIEKVKGDFRQKEILKIWKENLSPYQGEPLVKLASFKVACSSGTYVRRIANSLGEKIGIPALAFSIKRTKIGKYRQAE